MAAVDGRAGAGAAEPKLRRFRGLNGIRALSVLAIIAFHSGMSWIPGGYYGVDAFFVLSGFLITALLLAEWGASGGIGLRRFWGRRARRLLPALFLLVAVIGIVMATSPGVFSTPDALKSAFWTVFYGSNWYLIHAGVPYFSLSSQPSPWTHTWSLAIEEQFYLLWPIVLLVVLGIGLDGVVPSRRDLNPVSPVRGGAPIDLGRVRRGRLCHLFLLACFGALASAVLMAHLAPRGYNTRAYYGTDTRAQALLVGAAIAVGITLWGKAAWRPLTIRLASGLAIAGVAGTAVLWATTAETSSFAFRGGFLAASLASGAVVLGCVVAPRSPVVRLLELPPLPQMAEISYGMYLWYWPVLLVTSGRRLHGGPYELFVFRVVLTVAIAALSYEFVEKPVRYGALRRWRMAAVAPFGAAAALIAVLVSTLVPVEATALQGKQLHAPVASRTAAPAVQSAANHLLVVDSATPSRSPSRSPVGTPTTSSPTPAPHASASAPVKVLLVGTPCGLTRCGLGARGAAVRRTGRQRGIAFLLRVHAGRDSGALVRGTAEPSM